jgi:hypothetical protein
MTDDAAVQLAAEDLTDYLSSHKSMPHFTAHRIAEARDPTLVKVDSDGHPHLDDRVNITFHALYLNRHGVPVAHRGWSWYAHGVLKDRPNVVT